MSTVGSLCSGIGGLELGLELAGLGPVRWQCEVDPFCRRVLRHHWPDAVLHEDIRTLTAPKPVDVVCAGFPCQPASVAGKREGMSDARWLWPEVARVVGLVRPRFVMLENVPGLLTVDAGRAFGAVLGDLASLGFDAEWDMFRASDVGAPHRRERLFPPGPGDADGWQEYIGRHPERSPTTESPLRPGAHGIPIGVVRHRARALRALGNAVVPQVAALAWRVLSARVGGN